MAKNKNINGFLQFSLVIKAIKNGGNNMPIVVKNFLFQLTLNGHGSRHTLIIANMKQEMYNRQKHIETAELKSTNENL